MKHQAESAGANSESHRGVEARRRRRLSRHGPALQGPGAARAANGGKTWNLSASGSRARASGAFSLGRYEDVGLEAARHRANEITLAERARASI